ARLTTQPFNFKKNLTPKPLLNGSEKQLFRALTETLTEHYVFPQVSFNALITHAPWIKYRYWQRFVRQQFNTKYVDFVLCRKTDLKVIAIVEYDGTGHRSHSDERRDALLTCAGYR